MGVELVILYSIYAIAGSILGVTTLGIAENITVTSVEANSAKYVACVTSERNDAKDCEGLE